MQIKTKGGYVMQKLKGLWIPADILLNKELSDKEKNNTFNDFIFK